MRSITPGQLHGSAPAPGSKSLTQRALLLASLTPGTSTLHNPGRCDDTQACTELITALGARVEQDGPTWQITSYAHPRQASGPCGESATALRLGAPVAALSPNPFVLATSGSLRNRTQAMLVDALTRCHVAITETAEGWRVRGPLRPYQGPIDASVSSQHISGLMLALSACDGDSQLCMEAPVSLPYLRLTAHVASRFGIHLAVSEEMITIPGRQQAQASTVVVDGDWSGAGFLLVAGALAGKVRVHGLRTGTAQSDERILDVLRRCGAHVEVGSTWVSVERPAQPLAPFEIDVTQSPDLVCPLAALAAGCAGRSVISGVARLAHKETDRVAALAGLLTRLGIACRVRTGSPEGPALIIDGGPSHGGEVSAHGDHRIAMTAAVLALTGTGPVSIADDQCVAKSFPEFFTTLDSLRD